LGYFRAKHLFFVFTLDEVENDFQYVIESHFNSKQIGAIKVIDKQTRLKQQRLILELHRYRLCGKEERQELEQKAQQSAKVYSKLIYVFRELINYLTDQKIVIPDYSYKHCETLSPHRPRWLAGSDRTVGRRCESPSCRSDN
jgi:Domain of unknown function (DUF4158)